VGSIASRPIASAAMHCLASDGQYDLTLVRKLATLSRP
jgi:hypothetical protein